MNDPAAAANTLIESAIPVLHGMGVRFTEVRPGYAAASVGFEGNGNHFGTMYAGVVFSVAEVLGGALALNTWDPATYFPLVKSLTIDFLKPARTGVTARASLDPDTIAAVQSAAEATGKGEFLLVAEVLDAEGSTVARTTGTYQIRRVG